MVDSYKIDDYYTIAQVAEMLGLEKQTINSRCKKGYYEGAFKTEPNKTGGDPHGIWLIPKSCIDTPHLIQDVTVLTRQINPLELERIMTNAVTQAINPLTEKLENQAEIIRQLQTNIAELSRSARKQSEQESALSWWRVLLIIIFIIGIVFTFSLIFVNYFSKMW